MIPNSSTGLRIKACSRFIKKENLWLMDQRSDYLESSFHSSRETSHRVSSSICKPNPLKKFFYSFMTEFCWNSIVFSVNVHVLPRGQFHIQSHCLSDYADAFSNLAWFIANVCSRNRRCALGGLKNSRQHTG